MEGYEMTVRELIAELLELEMDDEIFIQIETDDGVVFEELRVFKNSFRNEMYLKVELDSQTIVDSDRLAELEELEEDFQ